MILRLFVCLAVTVAFLGAQDSFEVNMTAGREAVARSRYSVAQKAFESALKVTLGDARTAEALEALSDLNFVQGDYRAAEGQNKQALKIREQVLGAANVELAPYLVKMAGIIRAAGRPGEAEPLLLRSVALHEAAGGVNAPAIADDMDQLAALYQQMKRKEAVDSLHRALAIRMAVKGAESMEADTTLIALGQLYYDLGRYTEAEHAYKTALTIAEKLLGADAVGIIGLLDRLGVLYRQMNDYVSAEPYFQRGLALRERTLGPFHSDVAPALDNLALCYYREKKYGEAEGLYKRSLAIWEASQGPDSAFAAIALDNLGLLYATQMMYAKAEPLFLRALGIREGQILTSLNTLADLAQSVEKPERAELFYKRAQVLGDTGLGGEHPEIVTILKSYADLLRQMKRPGDAAKVEARIKQLKAHPLITAQPPGAMLVLPI